MDLPVNPPILPMLSKRLDELPKGQTWIFEPKWDGFRALIFRDGEEILIQSRDGKSLNRYFPELMEPLRRQLPNRCVLDGEIVIASVRGLDFDALQLRIHPAASRVNLLSKQIPASIVFFDLLCEEDRDLMNEPFQRRRNALEKLFCFGRSSDPQHYGRRKGDRKSIGASRWDIAQCWRIAYYVLPRISVRAESEYQQWLSFPPNGLTPKIFSLGAAYRFH
jgi:ATP-dependent DNA ligase